MEVSSVAGNHADSLFDNIPDELKQRRQWVVFKFGPRKANGKLDKIPFNPRTGELARVNDSATWGTSGEAVRAYQLRGGFDGIGYVFSENDPYTGIDLDGCRDPQTGQLEPWALNIVQRLDSYAEASPSGKGVHIFCKAILPASGKKSGQVEMYDRGRFFTITGEHLGGTPTTIEDRPEEVEALYSKHFQREEHKQGHKQSTLPEAEIARIQSALCCVSAVDYEVWLRVGMALHHADSSDRGFTLWRDWSATCPEKFNETDCHKKWRSFKREGITLGTLFEYAFREGWTGNNGKTSSPYEPPRPLRRQLPDPTPYPVEKLGQLSPVTKQLYATIQAPLALCGQSVLAATALAVQGYADISIDGRIIPLSENFITVGESGERKTAVDREVLRPHRAYEKTLAEEYETQRQDYENNIAAYKKAREEALKKAKTRDEKRKALEAVGPAPLEPLLPILLTEEPTYEGLIKLLQHGHPSLGLFADEAGRFVGGYGMSDEHQLKTAAGLCELWDGKRVSRVRGGDGAALLYGRRVAMHLMAQPQVAQRVLNNPLLIDQGLMSRCLVTWPQSTAGTRQYKDLNLRDDAALREYDQRVTKILKSPLRLAEGKRNELSPREMTLSKEAKALWIRFHDAVEVRLLDNQPFAPIRGFANKAAEHALRLAGILTIYEDLEAEHISVDHMGAGIDLSQHYLDEALRLFHSSLTDPDLVLAEKLLTWAQQRRKYVALVDIYQRGLNAISDVATARRLAKILEAHGWFLPVPNGMEINGQFRRAVWEVQQ